MGTIECSQPASKSSWDSQDFGNINIVLKMAHFRKSNGPRWVNLLFIKWFAVHGVSRVHYSLYNIIDSKKLSLVTPNPSHAVFG